jgi:hypothetical protein
MLTLGLLWSALWLLHARRQRRLRFNLAHVVVPMAVYLLIAWESSRMSYACNIF